MLNPYFQHFECALSRTTSVITSRPNAISRPSSPLSSLPLPPQIQLTIVYVYKLYLLTYIYSILLESQCAASASGMHLTKHLV